jgi:ATP-binding protein involved in chromosome partitioning
MADPRLKIISRRLARVKNIVAVSSGKGGVGKSVTATTLALTLHSKGYMVGLLDLDFTSPSTHLILGIENLKPEEEKGIIPPLAHGLKYMSIIHYAADQPAPLRGTDISNAIIELLAITQWGELDYLILDMPPGIGDAMLDIIRLMRNVKLLLVSTPSIIAFETVRKLIMLLKDLNVSVIGVLENMTMNPSSAIREKVEKLGVNYLGTINYDPELEQAYGNVERLMHTQFAEAINLVLPLIPS